jgi:uncharacterized membrane protein YheB (UPF0754 family)
MTLPLGDPLGLLKLASIPLVSAFIGWFTTFLAIRMIFRPRRPIGVAGLFTIQGLVPKRQGELARSIARTVEQHLLSQSDVLEILAQADLQGELDRAIREKIREFLDERLGLSHGLLATVFRGSMRRRIEALIFEEVRELTPRMVQQVIGRLEAELDFPALVEERIRAFDLDRLERIIHEIAARELRAIELICGLLGFLIGLVQLALALL